ncbi:hypothetical protein O6P43_003040 [Quillaja saponaria]|uniref:Uncharacterized protein n=1 Tax=Quillaja saponaria TaxID=32244 RepID=A0AAD7QDX9_QUISA|nr:hypothetical protein O6P43_003040 [Quillaja saponaria]
MDNLQATCGDVNDIILEIQYSGKILVISISMSLLILPSVISNFLSKRGVCKLMKDRGRNDKCNKSIL